MALKIKEVPPSVVGQKGTRPAYAVYDGSELVYKTKRGGGQGTAMYGFTEEKAAELLAKEEARRAEEGSAAPKKKKKKAASSKRSTSRATAEAPRPARQKTTRQKLTVDSCQSFLEDRGYKVSFSERSALAMLQPGFVGNPAKNTYVVFWNDPFVDPVIYTVKPGQYVESALPPEYEAYVDLSHGHPHAQPMPLRKAIRLSLREARRAEREGYDEGEADRYDRLLKASIRRPLSIAQAKRLIKERVAETLEASGDFGPVRNPRKRRRKNRDSRSSAYYSVAISKAHSLMMKEHNKTDNYADFVGIGYRRMSENPRLYLAHAVAESNAILNSRASASSKKAARQVIKAITDLHPELAQFESRSRSGIRKFNPRKNPARDSKGRFVKRKNPRALRRLR